MNAARAERLDRRRPDWIGLFVCGVIFGILVWVTVVAMQRSHRDAQLVDAVQRGDVGAVTSQLARHAFSRPALGRALYTCVSNPRKHSQPIFKALLDHGADPNSGLPDVSALEAAIQGDQEWAVKMLIERGANANHPGSYSGDLLAEAIQMRRIKTAELLLDKGANPRAMDPQKNSALYLAIQGIEPTVVRRLVEKGVDINAPLGLMRETPLILAVTQGDAEDARLFIEHGAKVDAADSMNMTALFCAVKNGQGTVVKALIAHGADVNRAVNGVSPLAEATARNNHSEVAMLRNAGAHR